NDAPSAITRLIEMQVETFLVGSAIDCVVAQRLARQLCEKCKQAYTPEGSELIEAGFAHSRIPDLGVFFRPSTAWSPSASRASSARSASRRTRPRGRS